MTLHQLYLKQIEAWKERLRDLYLHESPDEDGLFTKSILMNMGEWTFKQKDMTKKVEYYLEEAHTIEDFISSSRHKDTIELIEAEIERKRGELVDENFNSSWHRENAKGYNQAIQEDIAYLEEQLRLIKKEI